jgi:PEP-CTERM motif
MSIKSSLRAAVAASALGLAVTFATPALAGHTAISGPEVYTNSIVGTGDAAASADIRNGFSNPASNYAQGMATTQANSLTANGTTATTAVTTTSLQVPGRTSSASTYASLDTGIMRAQIFQTIPTAFGYPGADTVTQFSDTFFFTNTSGSSVNLDLTFSFDGIAQVFGANDLNGLGALILTGGCGLCGNAQGDSIRFSGTGNIASIAAYSVFNGAGVNNVYDQYSGQALNPLDFSVLTNTNGISSFIRTTVVIPIGETSLGFKAFLNLSARSAASADFGHTAQFGVGGLANGLSFTSASGVLLQGLQPQPGAVPEPATWAMMLFGFALVGSAMRRRAATRVVLV